MRRRAKPKQPDRVAESQTDDSSSLERQLRQIPFLDGRWIQDVDIVAQSTKVIHHGLKRQPRGWFLTDNDSNDGRISRDAWTDKTITLRNGAGGISDKTFPIGSVSTNGNENWAGGFYHHATSDNDFSGGPSFGTANVAYGAHFFVVLGAATVDELTLRCTGTSVTSAGGRTASDTEDIVIPSGTAADAYFETPKKWVGTVVITVVSGTAKTCNYGLNKYFDWGNTAFYLKNLECVVEGNANDTSAQFTVYHHKATGWTFNVGAAASPPILYDQNSHYVTEVGIAKDQPGAWKRTALNDLIDGSGSEGLVCSYTQGAAAKPLAYGYFIMGLAPDGGTDANVDVWVF